jgi:hypothetical protein
MRFRLTVATIRGRAVIDPFLPNMRADRRSTFLTGSLGFLVVWLSR